MNKPIAIVAGEPNSVSSEIIFKSWILRKKYKQKTFFIIGSIELLKKQSKKLKYNINIKKIDKESQINSLDKSALYVYNVNFSQQKPFQQITKKSNKYILNCFDIAINLIKKKKVIGLINCPVSKETLFKNKSQGVTEFLSKKFSVLGKEAMLIYNKNLSVLPITTHLPFKKITNFLDKSLIIKKALTVQNFYKKNFNKNPNIGILGLNPHNYSPNKNSEEKKIIIPAIKKLKSRGLKIKGPISPDTSFVIYKQNKLDVLIGMYHDQVLTPFKTLFKYDAINITIGLPYIRISPDHGVATNILGKKVANPNSLIQAIKFFNNIK